MDLLQNPSSHWDAPQNGGQLQGIVWKPLIYINTPCSYNSLLTESEIHKIYEEVIYIHDS